MRSRREPKRLVGKRASSMPGSRIAVRGLRMRSGAPARATPSCWREKATNEAFLSAGAKSPGMSVPPRKERSAASPTRESGLSPRGSAPAGQDHIAVGKGEHRAIPNLDREVPDRGWRCRQKTFPDSPHGGGALAAALEPGLEVVGLAHHLRV